VTDECRVDVALAVEGFFEGKDDEHLRDPASYPAQAALLPRPQLRADQPENRNAEGVAVFCQAEIYVGEIDQDGELRFALSEAGFQLLELGINIGGMADDFGEAHVGNVFGADDALDSGVGHFLAAESEEGCVGEVLENFGDEFCAVVIARGFACRDEDRSHGDSLVGAEREFGFEARGGVAEFLVLVLELVELPIEATLQEQLLVRAHLAELAFVHDQDGVGALHG